MNQFIIVLVALAIIFGFMMISLKFGKYRERSSGCCGGGHCEAPKAEDEPCCEDRKE